MAGGIVGGIGLDLAYAGGQGRGHFVSVGSPAGVTSPVDRAKGGVKRSLLTEAAGIPLTVEVAPANRTDMKLVAA